MWEIERECMKVRGECGEVRRMWGKERGVGWPDLGRIGGFRRIGEDWGGYIYASAYPPENWGGLGRI